MELTLGTLHELVARQNNIAQQNTQIDFIFFQLERQQTQEKAFELTQKLDADMQDIMPLLAQQVFILLP